MRTFYDFITMMLNWIARQPTEAIQHGKFLFSDNIANRLADQTGRHGDMEVVLHQAVIVAIFARLVAKRGA